MKFQHVFIATVLTVIFAAGVTACYKFVSAEWNTSYLHTVLSEKGLSLGYSWPITFYTDQNDVLLACQQTDKRLLGCAVWPGHTELPVKNCVIYIWAAATKENSGRSEEHTS